MNFISPELSNETLELHVYLQYKFMCFVGYRNWKSDALFKRVKKGQDIFENL
jgi:hypothetical protein